MKHNMKLRNQPFESIDSGEKIYELRLFDEKRKKIKIGDSITFTNIEDNRKITVCVDDIIVRDNFTSLFNIVELDKCGFGNGISVDSAAEAMCEYYSLEEQEKYSVIAIKMKKPDFSIFMPNKSDDLSGSDVDEECDDIDSLPPNSFLARLRNGEFDEELSEKDENTLSPILYALCFIVNSLLVGMYFQTSVYTHILGLTATLSKVVFCSLFFGLILLGYLKTFEDNRTLLNSVAIPSLPVGIYTIITYFRFYPVIISIAIVISGAIFIWLVIKHILKLIIDKFFFWCDVEELIVSTFKYVGITLGLLVVLMAYVPSFGLPEVNSKVESIPDTSFEDVYSVSEKKEELSKYIGDNWDEMTVDSRVDFLQHIANAEKRYLGLPHTLTVKAVVLETDLGAQYNHSNHIIEINYDYLRECDIESAISSLAHECRHAYQRNLVELYEESDEEHRQLYVFAYVPEFIENFNSYVDSEKEFDKYYNQAIEVDARAYSKIATEDILEALNAE